MQLPHDDMRSSLVSGRPIIMEDPPCVVNDGDDHHDDQPSPVKCTWARLFFRLARRQTDRPTDRHTDCQNPIRSDRNNVDTAPRSVQIRSISVSEKVPRLA